MLPSGLQTGRSSTLALLVIATGIEPGATPLTMMLLPFPYAILVPSGDQVGRSWPATAATNDVSVLATRSLILISPVSIA